MKNSKGSQKGLLTSHEVPDHFQEPFIFGCYRHPKSSFKQCVHSLVTKNNEMLNCWTHYSAALIFSTRFIVSLKTDLVEGILDVFNPLRMLMIGATLYSLCSACAHTFNTMSLPARHICFFVDYVGLSVYAFTGAISVTFYSLPLSWHNEYKIFGDLYLPASFAFSCFCVVISCSSRFMQPSFYRKLFRLSAFALPYLFDNIPVFWRTIALNESAGTMNALRFHQAQFMFACIAVLFYVSHWPERQFPGKFDVVGHSHQWFHLCSLIASYLQIRAAKIDLIHSTANPHAPHHASYLTAFIILVTVNAVLVTYFSFKALIYLDECVIKNDCVTPEKVFDTDEGNDKLDFNSNYFKPTRRRKLRDPQLSR